MLRAIDDWQWVGIVAGLLLFGGLAVDDALRGPVYHADSAVNDWVTARSSTGFPTHAVGEALSWPGSYYVATPVILGCVILWWIWGERRVATFAAMAGVAASLLVTGLKYVFERQRPAVTALAPHSYSFPSGHTMGATAVLGVVLVMGTQVHVDRYKVPFERARGIWAWSLTAWVVLSLGVGLARVLAQDHWMSDVLASWCLGLALVCAVLRSAGVPRRRTPLPEPAPQPVEKAAEKAADAVATVQAKP